MPPFLPRKRLRSQSPPPSAKGKGKGKAKASPKAPPKRATLFDDLDSGVSTPKPEEQNNALLAKLGEESDDSDLSSLSSSAEPEASSSKRRKTNHQPSSDDEDEDDEDIEFEDVETHQPVSAAPDPSGDLDLTLMRDARISLTNPHGTKKGPSKIERQIRVSAHCMHVQLLLWHNAIRNAWCCDKEVQEILVKQLGPNTLAMVEKWKINSGLKVAEETPKKGAKRKLGDARNQRDWGSPAERLENGKVNMSSGDPLYSLLRTLVSYWRQRFRITAPGLRKMGYMSLERLEEETKSFKQDGHDPERHGERIRNIEEFREHARKCQGSRDVGAQLFTALLRGLGIETRLVASLQPVGFGWSKNEEAHPRKIKKEKKPEEKESSDDDGDDGDEEEDEEEEEEPITAVSKVKKPAKKGKAATNGSASGKRRRTSTRGAQKARAQVLSNASDDEEDEDDDASVVDITPVAPSAGKRAPGKHYDKDLYFPHYWSEVLSPVTKTWTAVDAVVLQKVATDEETLALFEARGPKANKAKQVTAYIVGYSPDGTAKDVTVRYLKRHMLPGQTKGVRMPVEKVPVYNHHGKVKRYEEQDWFKKVMSGYVRLDPRPSKSKAPQNQVRTEIDDEEERTILKPVKPEKKVVKEGEETLQSYKTSADFVLERHLRREEALLPGAKHVKMFTVKGKGESATQEKVYRRKDVVSCKSTETWHKEGRAPKPGEKPLKHVPFRAATTNRKRELAEAEAASGEKMLQPLFSKDQTDWIIPPPIRDGVIPKNNYGNMDVYVPSMVPKGAVHIPRRSTKRICTKLGIDFAEAVVGFEFGHRMAVPIIQGVVVAEENEEMVLEQWEVEEAERLRKEDEKRSKVALQTWRKFLMGLKIIKRVREEYGDQVDNNPDVLNPWTNRNKSGENGAADYEAQRRIMERKEEMGGGFLPEGQDVEEPAQGGFFPTNHEIEDEEDGDGGGFVVEGFENRKASTIPKYDFGNGDAMDLDDKDEDDDEETADTPPPFRANGRSNAKKRTVAAATAAKRGRGRPKKILNMDLDDVSDEEFSDVNPNGRPSTKKQTAPASTPAKRGRGRPKKTTEKSIPPPKPVSSKRRKIADSEEDEDDDGDDDEESSLSELESALEEEVVAKSSKSQKTKTPAKKAAATPSKVTPRTAPRRQAARRSATALKSHYFEHPSDEDDEE